MTSYSVGIKTSLSQKPCIADKKLLWNAIWKSWSLIQNPSFKIARSAPWRRNHDDVISGLWFHVIPFITYWLLKPFSGFLSQKSHVRTILHFKYNIAIVRVLVKMCHACNTTIFIFAGFVVSLSLTHSVKCSVFYINRLYHPTSNISH